ncbi:MAG: 4-(cytidine 5'-diphospho)-2-C-methyl-D-erythritol kinase [Candidatus Protochlamydia sp.]|nr:4-(cytidine 5'-diphospho)-2-C-methyl-D-erythritol kinase [Candidatus Protochlamydia sp.]
MLPFFQCSGVEMVLRLFSPAKLNLSLSLLGRRPDGYHEISSIFQTISLGDFLTFQLHFCDEFTCSDPTLSTGISNLVTRALHLFRSKTGFNFHLKIHLDKRIPLQAGLGGGSGNAATTLWACNHFAGYPVSDEQLIQWGSEIGSDISFFFSKGTAHCTGRGEHVNTLPSLPQQYFWVIKPSIGLSTADVFKQITSDFFSRKKAPSSTHPLEYYNDLEQPAFQLKPELRELKSRLLSNGFEIVLMTGTGSSFFCFGQGVLPQDPTLKIFKTYFINRTAGKWFTL